MQKGAEGLQKQKTAKALSFQLFSESHIIIMASTLGNLGKWWLAVYSVS